MKDNKPIQNSQGNSARPKWYSIYVACLLFVVIILIVSVVVLGLATEFGKMLAETPAQQRMILEIVSAILIPPILLGILIVILRVVFRPWI